MVSLYKACVLSGMNLQSQYTTQSDCMQGVYSLVVIILIMIIAFKGAIRDF